MHTAPLVNTFLHTNPSPPTGYGSVRQSLQKGPLKAVTFLQRTASSSSAAAATAAAITVATANTTASAAHSPPEQSTVLSGASSPAFGSDSALLGTLQAVVEQPRITRGWSASSHVQGQLERPTSLGPFEFGEVRTVTSDK